MNTQIIAAELRPSSFLWQVDDGVATVTLSRPERKNPLTFESYAELRDTFRQLVFARDVRAVVITGAGENFCSGGDVHDIIGPLVEMRRNGRMDELLAFTRMTGDLVKAMRGCPQPIIAAIDGACVGAGAIIAMASDLRLGTERSKVAFLFTKVGPLRRRHGRVRAAAAHHRAGPRQRAALHRPIDGGHRGRTLGLLQPRESSRSPCWPMPRNSRVRWRTARPSPTA
jgi:enoyl-CoA hydratase/carnithine racemase